MKHYTIRFSPLAYADLESIKSYISYELHSPDVALNILEKLLEKIQTLKTFPFRHPQFSTARGLLFRQLYINNYNILYKVQEDNVIIMRILYSSSNILEQ